MISIERKKNLLKLAFALYAVLSLISMAPMNLGAAFLGGTILLTNPTAIALEMRTEWKRPLTRFYLILSFLLTFSLLLSLIYAKFFPLGYGGNQVVIHFFKDIAKSWYLFWPFLLVIGFRRLPQKDRWFIFWVWIVAFGLLCALGISQYFTGWPRKQPIPFENHRYHVTLFLGHHLSVASIFIFPFFCALDALRACFKNGDFGFKQGSRPLFALCTTVGCAALFLTYSRTLWIALPLGVLFWIILTLPKRQGLRFILCLFLVGVVLSQLPQIQRRIQVGMGIHERIALWQANFEFFKQRPFTGVGWRHTQELSGYYLMNKYQAQEVFSGHAHNNLLEMLGGTGLIGTSFWLAWCFGLIIILIKQGRTPASSDEGRLNLTRGLICAWVVFHLNGLTQVNFWEAKVQHQMAWAIFWSLL